MTLSGWLQVAVLFVAVLAVTKPLGLCMARVFRGERTWLSPVLRPIKKAIYRASGVDERREQGWLQYAICPQPNVCCHGFRA
ncbi:MAG: potassium-transporting ATPase subunit KdpA [Dehalococcoidia bacterium]